MSAAGSLASHSPSGSRSRLIGRLVLSLLVLGCFQGCEQGGALSDRSSVSGSDAIAATSGEDLSNRPLPPATEPVVRVRVRSYGSEQLAEETFSFGSAGQRLVVLDGARRRPHLVQAPLRISHAADVWTLVWSGERLSVPATAPLSIRLLGDGSKGLLFDDVLLPGALELIPTASGMDLVARLPMETYLPGVLHGELFPGWRLPTFQAQAIAARSYALAESAFWGPRRHYDVVAGPASQAWVGLETTKRAREAVDSTRGIVLLFDGRVVPAYYSSCCGGRSAAAAHAISDRQAHRIMPLKSRIGDEEGCCEDASVRSWTASFRLDALTDALQARGKARSQDVLSQFQQLRSVTLVETNAAGRALRFQLQDREGRLARLDARDLRRILNSIPRADGSEPAPLRSDDFRIKVEGDRLVLSGRGYGHGVGLCQYGAQAMSRSGSDWRSILARYYPGAEPTTAWPAAGN